MNGYNIGAGRNEPGNHFIRVRYHQMHVERQLAVGAQLFDDSGAESEVRHIMSVHNIPMNEVGSGFFQFLHISAQRRIIGRQHTRGNLNHNLYSFLL